MRRSHSIGMAARRLLSLSNDPSHLFPTRGSPRGNQGQLALPACGGHIARRSNSAHPLPCVHSVSSAKYRPSCSTLILCEVLGRAATAINVSSALVRQRFVGRARPTHRPNGLPKRLSQKVAVFACHQWFICGHLTWPPTLPPCLHRRPKPTMARGYVALCALLLLIAPPSIQARLTTGTSSCAFKPDKH